MDFSAVVDIQDLLISDIRNYKVKNLFIEGQIFNKKQV